MRGKNAQNLGLSRINLFRRLSKRSMHDRSAMIPTILDSVARSRCFRAFLVAVSLGTLGAGRVEAQLPQTKLATVFPPGGKQGTSVELVVTGADQEDANQLYFSHPGITAKGAEQKFSVAIGAEVPPGLYDVRVVGRFGLSNPRTFVVGQFPEVVRKGTNTVFESAQEVPLGVSISGTVAASGMDFYKFPVKKGQRVLIQCQTREIDSRMAGAMVLYSSTGGELERSRTGDLMDYTAPADGNLVVKVHDFTYRGGAEYFYRLTISDSPYIDAVLPAAVMAGTKAKVTLYGRNLPGGTPAKGVEVRGKPLEQLEVEIQAPAEAGARQRLVTGRTLPSTAGAADGFEYQLKTPRGVSNPVMIGFADAPVVLEVEPNQKPGEAQKITPPCEVAGRFYPVGDVDVFTFEAKKGDAYALELIANRMGLVADPVIVVQKVAKDEKGAEKVTDVAEIGDSPANIGGPEFNTASHDPTGRFEAKEDGTYRLQVRDLFNRGQPNGRLTYRLIIRKESPDFRLVALPEASQVKKTPTDVMAWNSTLRRGETIPVKLLVLRRDGFKEDIHVSVEGLPKGVTFGEVRIPANSNSVHLLLAADDKAAAWVGGVRVLGKAKVADAELVREARGAMVTWDVVSDNATTEPPRARMTRGGMVLAVSELEAAPFSIVPDLTKPVETSVAGKVKVPFKVARRGDFAVDLKLKGFGAPDADKFKELDVPAKATNVVWELDLSQTKLPAGTHSIYLQGRAKGKFRFMTDAAKAAEDAAKKAEKEAAELAAAAKAADEAAKKAGSGPPDAKAAAEKAAKEAAAKAKAAETRKTSAQSRMKEMADKSKPKDVDAAFYSLPVTLKLAPGPVTIAPASAAGEVAQGGKWELPVKINRLFDYKDPVELTLVLPKDVKGITAAKVTIPKDGTEGKLVVEAAANATPGEHKLAVLASMKLNNQDLKVEQPVALKVAAVAAPKPAPKAK